MKRRIGFGLRFSALVIDVTVIIFIVFGLFFAFGKGLYTSIGILKTGTIKKVSTVSQILNSHAVGGQPASTEKAAEAKKKDDKPKPLKNPKPEVRRTETQLPGMQKEDEKANLPTKEPLPVSKKDKLEQRALHKPAGYIHNSKDFVKIFFFAIISILFFLTEVFFGVSLGKLILGIKIFNNEREEAQLKEKLLRFALKIAIPCFIILLYVFFKVKFFWTLGMIWFFLVTVSCFFVFSDSMQTLYDRLTNCAVFSVRLKEEDETAIGEKGLA